MYCRVLRLLLLGVGFCGLIACSAKAPGPVETKAAYGIKQHITVRGRADKNPIPAREENIDAGKHVFGYYCVECHGRDV
jgi:mono/diheme cytochrome c family protein